MIGLIQKILFNIVESSAGVEKLNEIKKKANIPLEKNFQINIAYSDEEWQRLWKATLSVLDITEKQAFDIYADGFCKDAMLRFPAWFQMSKNSYEFLARQPAIHNNFGSSLRNPEERKAISDKFYIEKFDKKLITHYRSKNKHCGLYKSIAQWLIDYYKDTATITEIQCMHDGAPECEIHTEWTAFGEKSAE